MDVASVIHFHGKFTLGTESVNRGESNKCSFLTQLFEQLNAVNFVHLPVHIRISVF